MAELTGIEPAVSGVTGRHVNRYTTAPFGDPNGIRTRVASVKGLCVNRFTMGPQTLNYISMAREMLSTVNMCISDTGVYMKLSFATECLFLRLTITSRHAPPCLVRRFRNDRSPCEKLRLLDQQGRYDACPG